MASLGSSCSVGKAGTPLFSRLSSLLRSWLQDCPGLRPAQSGTQGLRAAESAAPRQEKKVRSQLQKQPTAGGRTLSASIPPNAATTKRCGDITSPPSSLRRWPRLFDARRDHRG